MIDYFRKKDKVCILHAGHGVDYILQLKALRPNFEKLFPEIKVTFVIRQEYKDWVEDDSNWCTIEYYDEDRYRWAYTIPIIYDAVKAVHPVLRQIEVSGIPVPKIPVHAPGTEYGVICPEGNYPVRSLDAKEIDYLKKWVRSKGFKPLVVGTSPNHSVESVDHRPTVAEKLNLAKHSGMVVGVECDIFWQATLTGTPTALVPNGHGDDLYKMFCGRPVTLNPT